MVMARATLFCTLESTRVKSRIFVAQTYTTKPCHQPEPKKLLARGTLKAIPALAGPSTGFTPVTHSPKPYPTPALAPLAAFSAYFLIEPHIKWPR